jgi:TnpA family transposase
MRMAVRAIDTVQKRLKILGEDEIDAIYGRPRFIHEDRIHYFSLAQPEKELLCAFRSVKSRAYFVLQLGYFKIKHLFFTFDLHEVEADLQYVLKQHFDHREIDDLSAIDKATRLKQQRLILELFNYRSCDAKARRQLVTKARRAATVSGKPIYLFRELMHSLAEQHIVLPGYSRMQEIIGQALNYEQNRLIELMRDHLTPPDIEALQRLLADSPGLYEITQLKREPRDFSAGEIKREIRRGEQIRPLYRLAQHVLPVLRISNESVKYYASLIGYYSVYKLKRLNPRLVYVYLLCFVTHRYQRLHDNLINSLLYNVRRYGDNAKSVAKEKVYECHVESNQNLKKAGRVLKLFTNDSIKADTPFQDVQNTAFAILERRKLAVVAAQIATHAKFDETAFQWEHIDALARQFKRHLRPILLAVDFATTKAHDPLMEAVEFLKAAFRKGRPLKQYSPATLPARLIPNAMKRYLYAQATGEPNRLLVDRYEFWVYRLLRNSLEAGDIFCRNSVRFRSFEDDLLDDERWQQKDQMIEEAGLGILKPPIRAHLAELKQQLETGIAEVNRRISSGENEHLQIQHRGRQRRWTLQYPRSAEPINHPFFDTLKQVDISSVLHFVNQPCRFMDAFEHVLGRYTKQGLDDRVLVACLIAWGTNLGLGRMGEISDISYASIAATSDSFIRLETLSEANDRVSNRIAQLPIFRHYDIEDVLHSSSDGQKFETHRHTINARHSPKYFGLKKGIVAYTLVANHVPVNAQIIGANEHESHYVFDILFNNTTDIQPEVHSTDTHGANQVNFALLHLFGYQFAPRYRDIYGQANESLYGFQHPSHYPEGLLKPIRKINDDLIIDEWENVQRIILSLAQKTTTQSIIIGKLSAYARKNKTKRALWEYDNIIKSLYLLDYIDSPPLRRNVQRALNRGENYHKLRRAVSYANFGKLRFKTEQEQQLWNECSRLITNCIIYYNASLLSKLLVYKETIGDCQGAALLKHISPVAWQHLNFYGRYEFSNRPTLINMDAIVQELAQIEITTELAFDTGLP